MYDCVVVHYAEIWLKGKNRPYFERLLMENIKKKLGSSAESIKMGDGQVTIMLAESADCSVVKATLRKIPGVAYFSFARRCPSELDALKADIVKFLEGVEFSTFKVDVQRHDKRYPIRSMDLNALLGGIIINVYSKKVKMASPDLTLKVELSSGDAYLSRESIGGVGGLPIDSRHRVVALLSGGFDSPVAAYLMMKRGCEVILVHFRNENQMSSSVEGKIVDLARQLSGFQVSTLLYVVPFGEIQKEIIMCVNSKLRMLVYRRLMIRIASKIAGMNGARFLVVGDSLSQVASQTMENLEATYADAGKHVLSPLIGLDKEEIISISRRIGTFDISALPYGDCCSYFLAEHPALKVNVGVLRGIESQFDVGSLVAKALSSAVISKF